MTTIALVLVAIAACGTTALVTTRLFRDDRGQQRRTATTAAISPEALILVQDDPDELPKQVAALWGMVLQLRAELAEAQRDNERSRARDLELLRFRGAELVREAEVRASASDMAARSRGEALLREWQMASPSHVQPARN